MDKDNRSLLGDVDDSDIDVCMIDDEEPAFFCTNEKEISCSNSKTNLLQSVVNDDNNEYTTTPMEELSVTAVKQIEAPFEHEPDIKKYQYNLENCNDAQHSPQNANLVDQIPSFSNTNEMTLYDKYFSCGDIEHFATQRGDSILKGVAKTEKPNQDTNIQCKREESNDLSLDGEDDLQNQSDSQDEDEENSEDSDDRFYFESDHLAFKHNKDYKALLKALVVLEAQRIQAVTDLQNLHQWKDDALKDPIPFIESLQSKNPPKLPKRQLVANLPHIDWTQYLTSTSLMKMPPGFLASTRRSFRAKSELTGSEISQEDNESISSEGSQDHTAVKLIRGRLTDDNNPASFNRLWTTEEQERLEKLLQTYPPEEVEARRWEKIAKALGNRTPKQVSSRVQKYFIKLARAGLPIPGRAPHMSSHKKAKINPVSYRNSTFFPSWKPSVYMNDDEDDASSVTTTHSDDTPCVSDEDMIPSELKETAEYKELISLKKYKKQLEEARIGQVHTGYMCDDCGVEPIKGTRWHCSDCTGDASLDVCSSCMERKPNGFPKLHPVWHRMVSIKDNAEYMDGDYTTFELQHGKYNYLDPNFIPKNR